MKTPLAAWENTWTTSLGAYFPGERVVLRGRDLFTELKDLSWIGLLIYGITGNIPDEKSVRLLNGIWTLATSYPDPRIWNNRIGALAGTARSTATLGVSAGIAITEAVVYGLQPVLGATQLLIDVRERLDRGDELADVIARRLEQPCDDNNQRRLAALPGFGRPVSSRDERIAPLMSLAEELGFAQGPSVSLAFKIEETLLQSGRSKLYLNVAGLMAALLSDQGYTPAQQYQLCVLCSSGGMLFCAADAAAQPQGRFFPMRCSSIKYRGKASRQWKTDET